MAIKKNKSKIKGSTWERDICKILSEHFDGSFTRTNCSGALIGGKNAFRKEIFSNGQIKASKGDIIPPDFLPKLVIEAKSYKEFSFNQLITAGSYSLLDTWISQTIECIEENDVWFLIFKITNKSSYICFEKKYINEFVLDNHCIYKNYVITEFKPFVETNKLKILELCT